MTNKDRLISLVGFAPNPNAVDGALLDAGITGSDAYIADNTVALKKCAIQLMELLLTTANTSFFNGATSAGVNYDRATLLKRIQALRRELGLEDFYGPTIIDKSYMW